MTNEQHERFCKKFYKTFGGIVSEAAAYYGVSSLEITQAVKGKVYSPKLRQAILQPGTPLRWAKGAFDFLFPQKGTVRKN